MTQKKTPERYVAASVAAVALVNILNRRDAARRSALDSLARYKFLMFGYHAAQWVTLNSLVPKGRRERSPFAPMVRAARAILGRTD